MKNFTDQERAQKMESRKWKICFVNEGGILEYLNALDIEYSENGNLGGDSGI